MAETSLDQTVYKEKTATVNPFDFDPEKSKNAFNHLISEDSKQVRNIFFRQQVLYERYQQSGLDTSQDLAPLAKNKNFPGNFSLLEDEKLRTSLTPDTRQALENLVNNYPDQLLQLNIPDFAHPTAEEQAELDTIMDAIEGAVYDHELFNKHWEQRREKLQEIDKRQQQLKLIWLEENLGAYFYESTPLNGEIAEIIHTQLFESSFLCKEALYYQTTLSEAVAFITHIAPSLQSVAEKLRDEVVLMKSTRRKPFGREENYWRDQLEGFSFVDIEGIPFVTVRGTATTDTPHDRDHVIKVVVMGHELFHGITERLLQISSSGIGERLQYLKKESGQHAVANLERVIEEGVSIAFEFEALSRVQRFSQSEAVLDSVRDYTRYRLENIKKANRQWSEQKRTFKDYESGNDFIIETDEISALAYSEGTKLAIALRRNGWTLNDLPELLEHVQTEVVTETGDSNSNAIYGVAIERNPSAKTSYAKITERIRTLKKND